MQGLSVPRVGTDLQREAYAFVLDNNLYNEASGESVGRVWTRDLTVGASLLQELRAYRRALQEEETKLLERRRYEHH